MKILIVDDREEERYLSETLLKGSGYEVVTAVNGAEALEKLRTEGFDMIVSDVLMPVMDGFRLCRECKGDEKLKDIPFIFHTATYKDERDEELASQVGADRYIVKPIEPEEFVKIIQGMFRDVEEGKIVPKKRVLEEEKEVLKLYSERLIAKLEKKMLDLEIEITERKRAQVEVEHLNGVLRVIRSVNQLIVKEKERDKLLKSACATLLKARDYESACICLFDESGMLVTHAEAGLGKDFLPMVERLKRGELTDCIERTLIQSDVVITKVSSSTCGDCPLMKKYSGKKAVTVRLEHCEKVYGLLKLQLSEGASISGKEQSLLREVTGDIAFALHGIELEEERKQAEEGLKIRDNAIASSINGIAIADLEGNITYVNHAFLRMWGYDDEKEVLGKNAVKFWQVAEKAVEVMQEAMDRGGWIGELTAKRKDGSNFDVQLVASVVRDEAGKPICRSGSFVDITERKRMEEKARELVTLKELDRLRSGLLANISHELRTPLTSIKGFASTLLDPEVKWSEEEQRDFLQTIDRESDRLIRLISDLLDMSRLEASALKLARDKYQVSKILDSINDRLTKLTEQHHQLKVIVPAKLPPVSVDETRIGQVLTNLVENATKFSPEGSEITIEARLAGDQINVSVTDRGQGIAPELLDKVFDRFYQAESIVSGRKSGTGLGLSICRGIIETHGGKIWVESKVGEGSKFSFSLPVSKGNEENA